MTQFLFLGTIGDISNNDDTTTFHNFSVGQRLAYFFKCASSLQLYKKRVVVMPHANAMTYLNDGALDPACYWHATIEELRKEPGK